MGKNKVSIPMENPPEEEVEQPKLKPKSKSMPVQAGDCTRCLVYKEMLMNYEEWFNQAQKELDFRREIAANMKGKLGIQL